MGGGLGGAKALRQEHGWVGVRGRAEVSGPGWGRGKQQDKKRNWEGEMPQISGAPTGGHLRV